MRPDEDEKASRASAPSLWRWVWLWYEGKPPGGWLDVAWGDDAEAAAAKLGLPAGQWTEWEGQRGYEAYFDTDRPVEAFGRHAMVRLFRQGGRLVGLSLRFRDGAATFEALKRVVSKEFRLSTTDGTPYKIFQDGSVVRLSYYGGDDTSELTLTGPEFGKALASYLLGSALGDLSAGIRR